MGLPKKQLLEEIHKESDLEKKFELVVNSILDSNEISRTSATKEDLKDLELRLLRELGGRIDANQKEVNGKFDSLQKEVNGKFDSLQKDLNGKFDSLQKEINAQTWKFLGGLAALPVLYKVVDFLLAHK